MSILEATATAATVFRLNEPGKYILRFNDFYVSKADVKPFEDDVELLSLVYQVEHSEKRHIEHYPTKGWRKDLKFDWDESMMPNKADLKKLGYTPARFNKLSDAKKVHVVFGIKRMRDDLLRSDYVYNKLTNKRVEDPASTAKCMDKISKALSVVSGDTTGGKTFSQKLDMAKAKQLLVKVEIKRNDRDYLEVKQWIDYIDED